MKPVDPYGDKCLMKEKAIIEPIDIFKKER